MDPLLWQEYESGPPDEEVGVIIRLAPGADPPPNVRVVSRFGDIVTARIRRGDIVLIRQSRGIISLKASTPVTAPAPPFEHAPERDATVAEAENAERASQPSAPDGASLPSLPEDGRGVVVGICDWGFDFTHPNFRNPDGTTRLLSLWDQRGFDDPLAPAPYNYGRLLTREAINAALDTPDPCATLGYHPASGDPTDTGAHGTHVADILAGNRREPGSQVGLASGADLVFVHLAAPKLGELGNLGDSVGLLEGLDFCRRQAAGRPCVLHLSAGKTGGEKRGLSPLERAVDAMLLDPGIALVQSVGNYANTAMHTHARVGPDQQYVLNWITPENDRTPNELEIWYSGEDVFDVTLIAPTGREFPLPLDNRMQLGDGTRVWGNFYHRLHEPNSGLNHIVAYLYSVAPSGMWRVALHGRDIVDGRLQAWIERDATGRYQSRFLPSQASSRYTTNTICNCYRAIAVGAYDATRPDRPPTRFSSRGPTADGRQKPEIAAPGYMIRAARSLPRNGWQGNEPRLCVKSGTSMAAPCVSGTVALMMQAAGRPLTIHEIRRALIGSADPHPGPSGRSSTQLGYGYLNTAAAVAAARRLRVPDQRQGAAPARPAEEAESGVPSGASGLSEGTGWAPAAVEDAASMTAIDPLLLTEHEVEDEADGTEHDEAEAGCGCGDRKESAQPEDADRAEVAYEDWEDEAEPIEVFDPAGEQIEAPFVWEDVRDALDAVDESDGLT